MLSCALSRNATSLLTKQCHLEKQQLHKRRHYSLLYPGGSFVTVKELIDKLKSFPPGVRVLVDGYEGADTE